MLHWNAVSPPIKRTLSFLMESPDLHPFRLIGGTALSLLLGHRSSFDLKFLSDAPFVSIDFNKIEYFLQRTFPFIEKDFGSNPAKGKSFLIGINREDKVKLDLYCPKDAFIHPWQKLEGVRMANLEDLIALKMDSIQHGGKKKDFWDLHELLQQYSIADMISFHQKRTKENHDEKLIRKNLQHLSTHDDDFNPICLKRKEWAFIKDDFEVQMEGF